MGSGMTLGFGVRALRGFVFRALFPSIQLSQRDSQIKRNKGYCWATGVPRFRV